MATSTILRGADLSVYINGTPFGIATDLRWSIKINRKPIYGIDNETPFELAPGNRIIQGVIRCFYSKANAGLAGIVAADGDLIYEKYSTMTIVDRSTGDIILDMQKMSVGDQDWEARTKSLVEGTFAFMAIPAS